MPAGLFALWRGGVIGCIILFRGVVGCGWLWWIVVWLLCVCGYLCFCVELGCQVLAVCVLVVIGGVVVGLLGLFGGLCGCCCC